MTDSGLMCLKKLAKIFDFLTKNVNVFFIKSFLKNISKIFLLLNYYGLNKSSISTLIAYNLKIIIP